MDLPVSQIMGLYNRMIRKFVQLFTKLQEEAVDKVLPTSSLSSVEIEPLKKGMEEELEIAGKEVIKKQTAVLQDMDLSE